MKTFYGIICPEKGGFLETYQGYDFIEPDINSLRVNKFSTEKEAEDFLVKYLESNKEKKDSFIILKIFCN